MCPATDWGAYSLIASLAVTRLQAIMSTYQIRRTKESTLDGKKLVDLPEKKIGMTALEFTKEEADIYKMVRCFVLTPPHASY